MLAVIRKTPMLLKTVITGTRIRVKRQYMPFKSIFTENIFKDNILSFDVDAGREKVRVPGAGV